MSCFSYRKHEHFALCVCLERTPFRTKLRNKLGKVSQHSEVCKSLTGKLPKPVSKPQCLPRTQRVGGRLPWGEVWSKRDCKSLNGRTRLATGQAECIRGYFGRVRWHNIPKPAGNYSKVVDAAGLDGKRVFLPRWAKGCEAKKVWDTFLPKWTGTGGLIKKRIFSWSRPVSRSHSSRAKPSLNDRPWSCRQRGRRG